MASSSSDPAPLALPPPPEPREFLKSIGDRRVLLSTDFDGTLTRIVDDPSGVLVSPRLVEVLHAEASRRGLLICTGRAVRDLYRHVPPVPGLDVIGNHGLEWHVKGEWRDFAPPEWAGWKADFIRALRDELERFGGELEDKGASLTLHYRGAKHWAHASGKKWLYEHAGEFVQVLPGRMNWNLIPHGFSKGWALDRYLWEFQYEGVLYFGDEETDETVFGRSDRAIWSIKVGEGRTRARYRIADTKAVESWWTQLSILDKGLM